MQHAYVVFVASCQLIIYNRMTDSVCMHAASLCAQVYEALAHLLSAAGDWKVLTVKLHSVMFHLMDSIERHGHPRNYDAER